MQGIKVLNGDCLDLMWEISDASADLILCDLPYGTTACSWDSPIDPVRLWQHYRRIVKPNGAIVLTASQPFTSSLVMSAPDLFKYSLVWEKSRATGHVHAKNKPMKKHEDILVFSPGTTVHASQSPLRMTYNPQGLIKKDVPTIRRKGGSADTVMSERPSHRDSIQEFGGYPTSILSFASEGGTQHPTQKPVALFEYLIRTYTDEGDTVLDNCAGSGTTGVAAIRSGRVPVLMEMDAKYAAIAQARVDAEIRKLG